MWAIIDGYYTTEVKPYIDTISNHVSEGYLRFVYVFNRDQEVIRYTQKNQNTRFSFDRNNHGDHGIKGEYAISNDKLYVTFDKGLDWELRKVFICKDDILICIDLNSLISTTERLYPNIW